VLASLRSTGSGEVSLTDPDGLTRTRVITDTLVDLPTYDKGNVFTMRQITRPDQTKTPRQVHILPARTDLTAGEPVHRMASRWRQENYFRCARMRFDLGSHDTYKANPDDPDRSAANPAKKHAHQVVLAAAASLERTRARNNAALLAARSPAPGEAVVLTNADHNAMTAGLRAAEADL